jgi:membrane protein YdbS with pleckstrin-like domain
MAFRLLAGLALICAVAAVGLFFLHAFSYVIALALAVVFALGALAANSLRRLRASRVR